MKQSIRDIVRRERWARNRAGIHEAPPSLPKTWTFDMDGVPVRVRHEVMFAPGWNLVIRFDGDAPRAPLP